MRRFVIVDFFAVAGTSSVAVGTPAPLGNDTGSSGMAGWVKPGFPSCDRSVEVEVVGDGDDCGRWVSVLVWPLISLTGLLDMWQKGEWWVDLSPGGQCPAHERYDAQN